MAELHPQLPGRRAIPRPALTYMPAAQLPPPSLATARKLRDDRNTLLSSEETRPPGLPCARYTITPAPLEGLS